MSDEDVQEQAVDVTNIVDMNTVAKLGGRHGLLFAAYMEDRAKWKEERDQLKDDMYEAMLDFNQKLEKVEGESRIIKFLYNNILHKPTPATNKVEEAKQLVEDLTEKVIDIASKEPDAGRYEIAMLGNNLFKPR